MLARLKQQLRAGVFLRVGGFQLTLLRIQRAQTAPALPVVEAPTSTSAATIDLASPAMLLLHERFAELRELKLPLNEADADKIRRAFHLALPIINPDSRGVALRNLLVELRDGASSAEVKNAATRAIAVSDLADGLVDRAAILRDDPEWGEQWHQQAVAFEAAYGAKIISVSWAESSRGASIRWFFEHYPHLAAQKDVLHIAPEPELQDFLSRTARSYVTLDATGGLGITKVADLCRTGLPGTSFDLVVCHRVLEHVLDDISAIREIHRVLRIGGVLQVSVPQAVHRARTVEWLLPDSSHHNHVRHYGADFTTRLEQAGFSVTLEDWLLTRPEEELRRQRAYPMRFYSARKGASCLSPVRAY